MPLPKAVKMNALKTASTKPYTYGGGTYKQLEINVTNLNII